MARPFFEIPYYHDYISPSLAEHLLARAKPTTVPELAEVGTGGGLETPEALAFLVALYESVKPELGKVLKQRAVDRKFLDERVKACYRLNRELNRDLLDPDYRTPLGLEDASGRVVFGPLTSNYSRRGGKPVATIPDYLKGPHVTLFGPPDSGKMAVNAMNAYHRKLPGEPAIVEKLLASQKADPKWGADDEDSKTPLRADLVDAGVNLTACFNRNLIVEDKKSDKKYELASEHLSAPIKRIPGLALPCTFLFHQKNPIPLHLYDFALHLWENWHNPQALTFYIPKLENEEEARYIHHMISTAETMIRRKNPSYVPGTIRLMIVLENPRAILRTHEIMDALHPYFVGASLGWHDYLGSTARLFKEDGNYRIPVKADPDIVIKYIKASHLLLAEVVGGRGGIKVGGMYGILPLANDVKSASFQMTLKGFIKDVITQMKRDLTGFWVAHPDFVRLGLALVEAWRLHAGGDSKPLFTLVRDLLDEKHHEEILGFIQGPDIEGLDLDDPNYVRSLIVADIKESDFIPNNHPDEIRYNVFQSLQYLTDWLCGNGCVALPSQVGGVPVRVMDDLATAERSRWEVWHELRHGRFSLERFIQIAHEEMHFIRKDLSDGKKIVQVKWDERTARWYPVAFRLMLQLMTARTPAEFATELLMPFTVDSIRDAQDPWSAVRAIDPRKYRLEAGVEKLNYYFEICGCTRFAETMAKNTALDLEQARDLILGFSLEEILQAASFHGNIGEARKTLDAMAAGEQALVFGEEEKIKIRLREKGEEYLKKFGFKFLISAKGKSGKELLQALLERLDHSRDEEMRNARLALWEISRKRFAEHPLDRLKENIEEIRRKHGITGAGVAVADGGHIQTLAFGEAAKSRRPVGTDTWFELASLSKTVGSAFAVEYFRKKKIPLTTPVNELLAKTASGFRIKSSKNPAWGDRVRIAHLMSHSALNMHYVQGVPADRPMPKVGELLGGNKKYGYEPVEAVNEPGQVFQYSGGGFLVLEHLLEALEGKSIQDLTRPFLQGLGLGDLSFRQESLEGKNYAHGYLDNGQEIEGARLMFPALAAGAMGTARDMAKFLLHLTDAFHSLDGSGPISHDTAVEMLHGSDRGCREFMGCDMGLGVFVAEAGENRLAIHQGANDGFRAIFIQCFAGPDRGKGLTVFCNGDNKGMLFAAETAQEVLKGLDIQGIDFTKFRSRFDFAHLRQEEIVNLGYKDLVFDAFLPDLPETIVDKGPLDPLSKYNLAVGAKVLSVTNQKFARAENLISPHLPVFDPELFGRQGKIMDSWESARHNPYTHDQLHLALSRPSAIGYISLSTKYHDGNQAEFVRLMALDTEKNWVEILPKTQMLGHSLLRAKQKVPGTFCELKVEMYPDGGLSRLGLFSDLPENEKAHFKDLTKAECVRFSDPIPKSHKPLTIPYSANASEVEKNRRRKSKDMDLACAAFGGGLVKATNEHYGPAIQVISPFPPLHMFDGLESARSRKPGHFEEVILQLGQKTKIDRLVMDFKYFVNNNPLEVSVHGLDGDHSVELIERTRVKAFAGNQKQFLIESPREFERLMIRTYPDGGVNRIKVFGSNSAV